MTSRLSLGLCLGALVLVAGCGDGGTVSGTDSGTNDTGTTDRDTGPAVDSGPGSDSGPGVDSGPDVDSGSDTDSGTTDVDSGTVGCAGIECAGYAAVLAAAPRGASSIDNCVIQLHQTDCCGATAAYGINHGARTTLCPAEATCVAGYPDPICTDDTITTDTGDTTTDPDNVRVRLTTDGTCETFVCETGPCRSEPGIAGGCGP